MKKTSDKTFGSRYSNTTGDPATFANSRSTNLSTQYPTQSDTTIMTSTPDSNGILRVLTDLQGQKAAANMALTEAQTTLSQIIANRQTCKRTIGWNNACLDQNTAAQNDFKTRIANLTARIVELDQQINATQVQYEAAVKAEAEAAQALAAAREKEILAQAQANPETAAIQAQVKITQAQSDAQVAQFKAQVEANSDDQELMIYAAAAVVVVIVLAVSSMYLLK